MKKRNVFIKLEELTFLDIIRGSTRNSQCQVQQRNTDRECQSCSTPRSSTKEETALLHLQTI